MARKPNPYLIDEDNPELTDAELARMRPAKDVLPPALYAELTKRKPDDAHARQESVEVVTLQIDADVLAAFRAEGEGWRERMAQVLRDHATALKARGA